MLQCRPEAQGHAFHAYLRKRQFTPSAHTRDSFPHCNSKGAAAGGFQAQTLQVRIYQISQPFPPFLKQGMTVILPPPTVTAPNHHQTAQLVIPSLTCKAKLGKKLFAV